MARTTAICQVFAIHPQRHLSRIGQCSDLRAHMLLGPPISDHFCHAPASLVQTNAVSWVERAPTGLTRKADYVRASEPHPADPDESDRCPDWRVTRGDTARDQHIPTLLSGLEANAQDLAGECSILEALEQHDPALVEGGVDPNQIDTADGDKIASHVFSPHRDQVIERLSLNGAGSSGLLPILAPIVLSFLMQQLQKKMGGGAAPRDPQGGGAQGGGIGDILGGVLGDLLGGGRR